jgi:glyoxylase-like metal-dependent hydrolase (beta-lactamase superfamily II)
MTAHHLLRRRVAIKEMGKAGLAVVVFGTAACSSGGTGAGTTSTPSTQASTTPTSTAATESTTTTAAPSGSDFERADLSFVSAYILYRAGEAALIDTGVDGSADAIEAALSAAGLTWGSVGHVILTHKHPDHVGSLGAVLGRAPGAIAYAGAPDIPAIASVLVPQPVGDGDRVFDLEIIETPGHTAGHISVLDNTAGILVTGDALNGAEGGISGPDPSFSENMTDAVDSVRKLAGFSYEVALFGHGEPVLEGASVAVADLVEGLG